MKKFFIMCGIWMIVLAFFVFTIEAVCQRVSVMAFPNMMRDFGLNPWNIPILSGELSRRHVLVRSLPSAQL